MRHVHRGRGRNRAVGGSEAGYSLVELLVSTAIMLVVTGAIFGLVNPAQGSFQTQPEMAELQQRMRVGTDMLYKDLVMAGAGPYQGAATGALTNFFAPILPYRTGKLNNDVALGIFYRPDAVSLVYVPNTASQTTISNPMPDTSVELKVNAQPNCPQKDPLCGFAEGKGVLIFDSTGAWDTFEITNVQSDAMHLQHRGQQLQKAYDTGANIAEADTHTYYFDAAQNQLRHYDGLDTDLPVVDNVVGVTFTYYGDPNPPLAPKPPIGVSNCVYDISGNPILPTLPATSGSLVELTEAILTDGPWCGGGTNVFDADLLRVRKVRVSLRMQAPAQFRGANPTYFSNPGQARGGERYIPDYSLTFEVAPRNLNLAR